MATATDSEITQTLRELAAHIGTALSQDVGDVGVINGELTLRCPVGSVLKVLTFLRAQRGVQLARMSGSGATCFALFDAISFAEMAHVILKAEKPDWWSAPCRLGAAP